MTYIQTSFTDWNHGSYLQQHGIKGQKWGVRNYQNADGTLTAAGRARYGYGEGGSKRMARKYNRAVKKLNKLRSRADIETQKANIEKYENRAKKAAKVGKVAAGVAAVTGLGAKGASLLSNKFDKGITGAEHDYLKGLYSLNDTYDAEIDRIRDLERSKKISVDYGQELRRSASDNLGKANQKLEEIEKTTKLKNAKYRDIADIANAVQKGATYAAAGTAAVAYGVAAYNKIQSHMAKTRISEVGHQKAVQNVKQQVAKMEEMFANTPYAKLVSNAKKRR